jgi:hypothetical protein
MFRRTPASPTFLRWRQRKEIKEPINQRRRIKEPNKFRKKFESKNQIILSIMSEFN